MQNQFFIESCSGLFLNDVLWIGVFVFFTGIVGIVFVDYNLINFLIYLELLFLGAGLNFVFFSLFYGLFSGLAILLFLLAIIAAESTIGLAAIIAVYGTYNHINPILLNSLCGW